jgi:hypothetical protein
MTIYNTAYDTTLGKALSIDKTLHALKQNLIMNNYKGDCKINLISSIDFLPIEINGINTDDSNVPIFNHPMYINNFKDISYLAVDLRLVTKIDEISGDKKLVVRNTGDYDFIYSRYVLNYLWMNNSIGQIKKSLEFGSIVYSQWLSEIISRRFALDPRDQIILSIISHFFYQSLFYDTTELTENFKQLLVMQAIRATKAPSELVMEVVDKITPMQTIDDYCANVKSILENIRLKDFNSGLLITVVSMSWYGLNAKENIIISLEHIPTWLAICYSALTERTYKNTTIYKIAEKYGKRGNSDEFISSYRNLIKSVEVVKSNTLYNLISESIEDSIKELENRVL